jgi:uncharacterized protein (DUF2461 family)
MTSRWYYKYLPWFILERKINTVGKFYTAETWKNENTTNWQLLEIVDDSVWILTNQEAYLKRVKQNRENEIKKLQKDLEEINNELEKCPKDLAIFSSEENI